MTPRSIFHCHSLSGLEAPRLTISATGNFTATRVEVEYGGLENRWGGQAHKFRESCPLAILVVRHHADAVAPTPNFRRKLPGPERSVSARDYADPAPTPRLGTKPGMTGQMFSEFPARLAVLIEQGLSPLPFWITAVAAPFRTSNALRSSHGSGAIREKEIPRIMVPNGP